MEEICEHNQGLYFKRIMKPYYDEYQYICSKCHKIVNVRRDNNLISSHLGMQDPNGIVYIDNEKYVLSGVCKEYLKKYENAFSLIDQVASKLPEGQSDPHILALFNLLFNQTDKDLYLLNGGKGNLQLSENNAINRK